MTDTEGNPGNARQREIYVDGAAGVEGVCRNLVADLDLTLGLTGRTRAADLDRSLLVDEREL